MENIENYKKEKLTINLVWANIFGFLIIIPIVIIFGLPYYFIWRPELDIKNFMDKISPHGAIINLFIIFIILIFGIVLHELIHGITWAKFAKAGFKSIKFGILKEMLTPYCHCKEPLKVKHYIFGAITPAIITGIIPAITAIFTGNLWLLIFGMFFTMAAAGDFMIINLLRKENKNDLVQDHPSEAGCFIYRKPEN